MIADLGLLPVRNRISAAAEWRRPTGCPGAAGRMSPRDPGRGKRSGSHDACRYKVPTRPGTPAPPPQGGPGAWVSGQFLSEQMAMTRSAVWKPVGALKADGYGIESSTRKGYRPSAFPTCSGSRRCGTGCRRGCWDGRRPGTTGRPIPRTPGPGSWPPGRPGGDARSGRGAEPGRGEGREPGFRLPSWGFTPPWSCGLPFPPGEAPRMAILAAVAVAEAIRSETGLP
jgi:biotin operon repressor